MKTLFKLLLAAFFTLAGAAFAQANFNVEPAAFIEASLYVGGALTLIRLVVLFSTPKHLHGNASGMAYAVWMEFWDSILASNLFRSYEWLRKAKDRSGAVLNNAVVHIPQAGAIPNVVRNRQMFPLPVVRRVDTDITYNISELSSDGTHIRAAEKIELSFDKISDVLSDHLKQINLRAAQEALFRWFGANVGMLNLQSSQILRTSGTATAGLTLTGATGNRNRFLIADVASAKQLIIQQTKKELNPGRRFLIMNESMYTQLKGDPSLPALYNLPIVGANFSTDGDLTSVHGFQIIRTDCLPRFNNGTPPQVKDPLDPSVVNAATDNDCALLVDMDFVHIAFGGANVYQNNQDATYQGDIYSALLRIGASRERLDQAGVVAIVQQ